MRTCLVLILLLASCTYRKIIRQPKHLTESSIATVAAPTHEQLDRLRLVVEYLEPKVRKMLSSSAPPPIVWRDTHKRFNNAVGLCSAVIVLGTDAPDSTIAHELAHWHSDRLGTTSLPRFAEEAFASVVEERLFPRNRPPQLPAGYDWVAALDLDYQAWIDLSSEETWEVYDAAYIFGEAIGLERLLEMKANGENSPEELIRAAGLSK